MFNQFFSLCTGNAVIAALNNIFNFLVNINAASNFILYCALSDKYRKTVKDIFCGIKNIRKNTLSTSRITSGRTTSSSFYSRANTGSFFNRNRFRSKEPKRFSISKEEYENLRMITEQNKLARYSASSVLQTDQSRANSLVSRAKIIVFRLVCLYLGRIRKCKSNIRFSLLCAVQIRRKQLFRKGFH